MAKKKTPNAPPMALDLPRQAQPVTELDRSCLCAVVDTVALRIPANLTAQVQKALAEFILRLPRFRSIVDADAADLRLVVLRPECKTDDAAVMACVHQALPAAQVSLVPHTLTLDYDYWSAEQVLRALLPDSVSQPSSFELVGHIVHLNLREEHEPFKTIIAQVILDKNPAVKTVINKLDSIDHTFRFFKMEVLAGQDNLIAEQHESGCTFKFDFSTVYWNSRLQAEHRRLVNQFAKGSAVCDVFGGVGPFAIPAAKLSGCTVFCNDLNPASYKWLQVNMTLNKVCDRVRAYNLDGRAFIGQALAELNSETIAQEMAVWKQTYAQKAKGKGSLKRPLSPTADPAGSSKPFDRPRDGFSAPAAPPASEATPQSPAPDTLPTPGPAPPTPIPTPTPPAMRFFDHYVMNLPASAIQFLDAFHGLLAPHYPSPPPPADRVALPLIHVHCFSRHKTDPAGDAARRFARVLGVPLGAHLVRAHRVRDVAPNKEMLCVSFRLPWEVAFGTVTRRDGAREEAAAEAERAAAEEQARSQNPGADVGDNKKY